MAPKVLFVLTSHSKMGNLDRLTGWYLPEFAHPYDQLKDTCEIVVASPAGGEAPLDPSSVTLFENDPSSQSFLKLQGKLWKETEKLSSFVGRAAEFDAVFYVGGHGPVFDLATDETSHAVIREFAEAGKVVSAVCHGPAALVYAKLSDGSYLTAGQPVTGFSNSEEDAVQLSSVVPFLLQTELDKNSGGHYVAAADWAPNVVTGRGGKLITGQNPASAKGVGEAILKAVTV